jgi:glycosyltransferase involved in cell wall biosynthesis
MPVYNGEAFLEKSLLSLLDQSFSDFELVISDNASTDRTEELCRTYASRDSRIVYFRQPRNIGAADNYNYVFRQSTGAYFKWAAADDLCEKEFLERCVHVLNSRPDAVLCYAKTNIIGPDDRVMAEYDDRLRLEAPEAVVRFKQLAALLGECNAVFGLIRAEALAASGLIGKYIGSDVCLLLELSLRGKFYELPDRLFLRREHPAASSCNRDKRAQMDFFDPALRDSWVLPHWRRQLEKHRIVRRSLLSRLERSQLHIFLLRNLWWSRKAFLDELIGALTLRLRYRSTRERNISAR